MGVACPKPSRFTERQQKKAAEAKRQREVYAAVDRRDGYRCRVCGTRTNPRALTFLDRGHHHHIVYRSAGGPHSVQNCITVCQQCHSDEHHHRIRITGTADDLRVERL